MKQLILDLAWEPLPPFAGFMPGDNAAVLVAQLRDPAVARRADLPVGSGGQRARPSCCWSCRRVPRSEGRVGAVVRSRSTPVPWLLARRYGARA